MENRFASTSLPSSRLVNPTLLVLVALAAAIVQAVAQEKPMASPPAVTEGTIDGVKVRIDYHQPSARGRKVMGALVPFAEVWRTGANATTSIDLSAQVKVQGKELAKGKYALFTIPGESEWTIIFNQTIRVGAYSYKEAEDVLRVTAKSTKTPAFVEIFTISIVKDQVVMQWENTQVAFSIAKQSQ